MTSIIDQAKTIIDNRQQDYGDMNESFTRIAGLWSAYIGVNINPSDVAKMMILLKVSRAKHNKTVDSYVDIIGYAECANRLRRQE